MKQVNIINNKKIKKIKWYKKDIIDQLNNKRVWIKLTRSIIIFKILTHLRLLFSLNPNQAEIIEGALIRAT